VARFQWLDFFMGQNSWHGVFEKWRDSSGKHTQNDGAENRAKRDMREDSGKRFKRENQKER
jgi:hypothetical protein